MRIVVLSDTHDHLPDHLISAFAGADEIWHLGDVCRPSTLAGLLALGPPVRVVHGNCDSPEDWPLTLSFTLEGQRIHLEHIPSRHPPSDCDLFLHGHTHVPRDETLGGVRFLNPGCITRPNRGAPASYAWLTLHEGQEPMWKIVRI